MEPIYEALQMVDLRVLARERGLGGYSRLRKDGLIALLWNNQDRSYESMKLIELRALMREHRL